MADNPQNGKVNPARERVQDGRDPVAMTPLNRVLVPDSERGRMPTNITILPNDINSGRMPTSITPLSPGAPASSPTGAPTPPPPSNESK